MSDACDGATNNFQTISDKLTTSRQRRQANLRSKNNSVTWENVSHHAKFEKSLDLSLARIYGQILPLGHLQKSLALATKSLSCNTGQLPLLSTRLRVGPYVTPTTRTVWAVPEILNG